MYTGPNHPNWKGGENAYRDMALRSNLARICKRCGQKDERLLAVHHIDENRKNNILSNLVWLCYNCHYLIHKDKGEKKKFMEIIV